MNTLAIVVTPHIGTLDSWLPVLVEAKGRHPDWRILTVLPRPERVVSRLDAGEATLMVAERISDEILVLGFDGRLYSARTFVEASNLARTQWRVACALAGLPPLRGRVGEFEPRADEGCDEGLASVAHRQLVRVAFWALFWRSRATRRTLESLPTAVVCSDFRKVAKGSVPVAMAYFAAARRLSIEHGLGTVEPGDPHTEHEVRRIGASTDFLRRAYCYHAEMATSFRSRYGLTEDAAVVTGIPRHDQQAGRWREAIAAGAGIQGPIVAIISNPTSSQGTVPSGREDYLPIGFKKTMLREVHAFARSIGATTVVRIHPSEDRTATIAELRSALAGEETSEGWSITGAHSRTLADAAVLAVTFSSSVKADFVAAGVPVIDVSPGPPVDVCPEARAGLAVIAHDVPALQAALRSIVTDRERIVREQRDAYLQRFADADGSVARILRDVEALLRD
jgi:hypothetical protein